VSLAHLKPLTRIYWMTLDDTGVTREGVDKFNEGRFPGPARYHRSQGQGRG
jgi:hypothetical protein